MTSEPYRSQGIPNKSQEARGACPPLDFAMMNRFFQPPDCHFMQEDGSFSIVPDIETDMGAASVRREQIWQGQFHASGVTTAACKFGGSSRFPTDAAEEADADATATRRRRAEESRRRKRRRRELLGCCWAASEPMRPPPPPELAQEEKFSSGGSSP